MNKVPDYNRGSKGWNKDIEKGVIEGQLKCDGQMVDFAWRQGRGSCRAIRGCAQAAINELLRSGHELPAPDINTLTEPMRVAIPVVDER